MPSALRNGLVWLLLTLVPALWIAVEQMDGGEHPAESERSSAPQSLRPITVVQGRLSVLLGGQALEPADPLGTRPMARLAAAMVLARADERERGLEQIRLAQESKQDAPPAELVEAVRAAVTAWPARGEDGERANAADALTVEQWKSLDAQMGWFATLARADLGGDPVAQKDVSEGLGWLMMLLAMAAIWFVGVGLAGLVLLVVLASLAILKRIRSGIETSPSMQVILGETFIAWMLVFLVIRVVSGWLFDRGEPGVGAMWLSMACTFASLLALAWVRVRGVRWSAFTEAAGLRWHGGLFRFCWMSATSYACALPCMGVGVAVGLALSSLMKGRNFQDVSHPVQEMLPGASGGMVVALFSIACVAAPVVEEIAFRGLLYGHVRQETARWRRFLSIAFAMLFSATIFAAIHPQGVLAVPALAGVSLGFCITREWSGSVYPGMVAHGVHNGILLSLNMVLQP
jgi:membrane protease YdiL (CAAX protease family)